MALNTQQVADAQTWINNNYGGSYDPSGQYKAGTLFNNGAFSDPNHVLGDQSKQGILGAAQGMGYTPADVSQIFGGAFNPQDVQTYAGNHQPLVQSEMMKFEAQHGMPVDAPGAPGGSPPPPAGLGGNLGMGGVNLQGYQQNPYLTQMAQGLQRQFNDNLTMNTLPAIRGGAVATGGVGGSREGIAQGLAVGQSNKGAADAISNLFGNDYQSQMARNLQQYGMDQGYSLGQGNLALGNKNADYGYNLGLGNLGLGYGNLALGNKNADYGYNLGAGNLGLGYGNLALGNKNADYNYNLGAGNLALGNQNSMQNFYTGNRSLDQSGAQLGANLYNLGNQGQYSGLNNINSLYSNYTGYGSNTSTSGGGGLNGALGGGIAGSVIGRNLGFGGGYDWATSGNGMPPGY